MSTAYLSGNLPFVWKLVIGSTFVLVIVALPQGIVPLLTRPAARCAGASSATRAGRRGPASEAASGTAVRRADGAGSARPRRCADVRKQFGSLKVLEGIDFTARRSELLSLVGPNGAGKTTLMRCIADGGERSAGRSR